MKKIVFIIFLFISVLAHAQIEVVPTQKESDLYRYEKQLYGESYFKKHPELRYDKGLVLKIGEYESKFIKGEVSTYDGKGISVSDRLLQKDYGRPAGPSFFMTVAEFKFDNEKETVALENFINKNREEILEKYGIYMEPHRQYDIKKYRDENGVIKERTIYCNWLRVSFCYYEDWEAYQADLDKYGEVLKEWEKQKENRIESLNNLL